MTGAPKHSRPLSPLAELCCPATPDGVRATMRRVRAQLAALDLDAETLSAIEIGLTETLNNVVEHACAAPDLGPGGATIRIRIGQEGARLEIAVTDSGAAMPDGTLPDLGAPDLDRPMAELPEGGFGWFLIRQVASGVRYERAEGCNRLTLSFDRSAH